VPRGIQGSQTREITSQEAIAFRLDVSRAISATAEVTDPDMQIIDLATSRDVTASITSGTISVNGQKITLKRIERLSPGRRYQVNVAYTKEGNRLQTVFEIVCPF